MANSAVRITSQNEAVVITVSTNSPSADLSGLCVWPTTDSGNHFLECTIEHLHSQLDWLLGIASDQFSASGDQQSKGAMSMATPNLQRKGSIRRPRWRTVVSLPFGADGSSADDQSGIRFWQKVEDMAQKMKWTQINMGDLDISSVKENRLSAVLQFYQQTCPTPTRQWAAASLMVNYTLTLIQQEIASTCSQQYGLQFMDFDSFGSACSNTCISRGNRFDVLLLLLPSSCSELTVHHCGVCDDIPPGKLVIGVKETSSSTSARSSALFQKDRVGDSFGTFLSQKEVARAAQNMLSSALDRLRLKSRSYMDRLPFTLQMGQYNELQLTLDTRMLNGLGLGLPKITINFTPAIRVSSPECDPLPILHAVPAWKSAASNEGGKNRMQSRIMRNPNQGVAADLLWQLNGYNLTKAFMTMSQQRISTAGVVGCQVSRSLRRGGEQRATDGIFICSYLSQ
jgi:hypothetical protein